MSSKAENTSHNLQQEHRLNIFFRSPVLLKIVAWLGCLGFIGSTGLAWADLKPISVANSEAQALVAAAANPQSVELQGGEMLGPSIPAAWLKSPTTDKLVKQEVPVSIAPPTIVAQPTGKVFRPQHADLLTADNYTVGVNAESAQTRTESFVSIPVPLPRQTSEALVPATPQRVNVKYSNTDDRLVAKLRATTPKQGMSIPTPVAIDRVLPTTPRSRAQIKPVVVTPMKPSVTARQNTTPTPSTWTMGNLPQNLEQSIQIPVPPARIQFANVQAVAQLPQISTNRSIPVVAPIPTVRPAGQALSLESSTAPYLNNGEHNSTTDLVYPLASAAPITSGFGWRTHPITGSRRFHSGIDIGAAMGAPVVAAGSGTIVSAGRLGGYGNAIVIQHNGVQQTLYGHLSEVFVEAGQNVTAGTVIGRVGSSGQSTGPHLHFESRMSTADGWVAVDPSDDVKYALDRLQDPNPVARRDLTPTVN